MRAAQRAAAAVAPPWRASRGAAGRGKAQPGQQHLLLPWRRRAPLHVLQPPRRIQQGRGRGRPGTARRTSTRAAQAQRRQQRKRRRRPQAPRACTPGIRGGRRLGGDRGGGRSGPGTRARASRCSSGGDGLQGGHGPDLQQPGALQYLTFTRPDLTYAVQQVCLHMHDPRESHLAALKRLLRYVRGTVDLGLVLHRSSSAELVVYTDADWAGCPDTRRSTSGYAVFLGGNLVSWSSKRQPVVSRSSAEAEYRAVANGVAEASWLRQLLAELHSPLAKSTLVYCDNVSAVYLSTNPVQHQRTKHMEIDLHFIHDRVAIGDVRVLHVPTSSQFADIFTKGLPSSTFSEFRSSLNVAGGKLWLRGGGICPLYSIFTLFLSSLEHRCIGSSDCEGVLAFLLSSLEHRCVGSSDCGGVLEYIEPMCIEAHV